MVVYVNIIVVKNNETYDLGFLCLEIFTNKFICEEIAKLNIYYEK